MHPFIAEQLVADRHAQALADAHRSRLARAAAANRPAVPGRGWGPKWRHRLRVGSLGLLAALAMLAAGPRESGPYLASSGIWAEPVTLVGHRAIASEQVSYEPGASRTWSPGSETLGVKVLSGRLTIYGTDGSRRVYIAGEGYAAGWAAHRTANETDERVETLVTSHVRP